MKFSEFILSLDENKLSFFLLELKENFDKFQKDKDYFFRFMKKYNVDADENLYYEIINPIIKEKIKTFSYIRKENLLDVYKTLGLKDKLLKKFIKSKGIKKYLLKKTITSSNSIIRGLWYVVSTLFSFLQTLLGFLLSPIGLVILGVIFVVIIGLGLLLALISLLYQPLFNVPAKFSMYEMYVSLNSDEVKFGQAKDNNVNKILNFLLGGLPNKNEALYFLRNNQASLAKEFLKKCAKYSVLKELLIEYKNKADKLSGDIVKLEKQLSGYYISLSGYKTQLSGLNLQLSGLTQKLLKINNEYLFYKQYKNFTGYKLLQTGVYLSGGFIYSGESRQLISGFLSKLENEQNLISEEINNLETKKEEIEKTINQLNQKINQTKTQIDFLKSKLENLKKEYTQKLQNYNFNVTSLQNDLFNGGFGANVGLYRWYRYQLETQGWKINDYICKNAEKFAYAMYLAPGLKKFKDKYYNVISFVDFLSENEERRQIEVFEKYYNSIVKVFKQLGKIYILKNWLSGKFKVQSKGILGFTVYTNDEKSAINVYNPFLFEKNEIVLKQNNENKPEAVYKGYDIDLSLFKNWFYDVGIKDLNDLPVKNSLDVIKGTQENKNVFSITVNNNFIKNECGIEGLNLKQNLKIFITYDGVSWYYKAENSVKAYERCLRHCRKHCDPYEDCYKPIFVEGEQKEKTKYLKQQIKNQTQAFCQQLRDYLNSFGVLDNIKQNEFIKTPQTIQVCYTRKPIFFDWLFKYDFKVYDNDDLLINSFDEKYHKKDIFWLPYFYKVSLPYKVCYEIDNIYLTKKLYNKLIKKGGIVKNYSKPQLGFMLNGNIKLKLKSRLLDQDKEKSERYIVEKQMFDILNKTAQFNPEKIFELVDLKNGYPLSIYFGIDIQNKQTINYNSKTVFSIGNLPTINGQYTHTINYLTTQNKNFISYRCDGIIASVKGVYVDNFESFLNNDFIRYSPFTYQPDICPIDYDKIKKLGLKDLIEKDYVNSFKLTENLYIAQVLNYLRKIYFNISKSLENNYTQNLMFFGDENQIKNYYEFTFLNEFLYRKLSLNLNQKIVSFRQEFTQKINKIKQKRNEIIATSNANFLEKIWYKIKEGFNFISDTLSSLKDGILTLGGQIKQYVFNNFKLITNFNNTDCLFSTNPGKCYLKQAQKLNPNTLDYLYNNYVISRAKPGVSFPITLKTIVGYNWRTEIFNQKINSNSIYLNSFYTLFRRPDNKKEEQKLKIDTKINNILTTDNPNNLFNTYGLDHFDTKYIIENMLSNPYIVNKLKNALIKIFLYGYNTNALDNITNLKYKDIDIDDVNKALWTKLVAKDVYMVKDNLIKFYQNYKEVDKVKVSKFKLWFFYHIFENFQSPYIEKIDIKLKEKYPDLYANFVKQIHNHKFDPNVKTTFIDFIIFRKNDKQYDVFKKGLEKLKTVITGEVVIDENTIKQIYGFDNYNLNKNLINAYWQTAKFLSTYYNNNPYLLLNIDEILPFIENKRQVFNSENLFLYIFFKSYNYAKNGYIMLNLDTNFFYKLFNGEKIGQINSDSYLVYLVNFFKQTNKNIKNLKDLVNLVVKLKTKAQFYEIADIYLLDFLVNQENIYMNFRMGPFSTYSYVDNVVNGRYLPVFWQYNFFDAFNLKKQLNYLSTLANVNLEDYYFKIFKKALKEKILCEKIFSGNSNLITKCEKIKQDLLASPNLLSFKYKMTKYSKQYGFEELWNQIGGLILFIYNNQRFVGNPWDFRQTDIWKQKSMEDPNWYKKIAGAPGNCTWYTNYLHFNQGGINGHAKDWCENAKRKGYKVIYIDDVNSLEQIPIGAIVVFNEYYPTYYNYQMKNYGELYGHVGTYIGYDKNADALLVEEMNFTSLVRGGSTLWIVDRRWVLNRKKEVKCFIDIPAKNLNF